jgi:hypothetical protein
VSSLLSLSSSSQVIAKPKNTLNAKAMASSKKSFAFMGFSLGFVTYKIMIPRFGPARQAIRGDGGVMNLVSAA